MKIQNIQYSKVFSLGNYENEKIGVQIDLEESDDPIEAHLEAVQHVEKAHLFSSEFEKYQRWREMSETPDEYTGNQVKEAKQKVADFEHNFSEFINAWKKKSMKKIVASNGDDDLPFS